MKIIEKLTSFMKTKLFEFTLKPDGPNTWIFSVDGIHALDQAESLIGDADIYGVSENLVRTGGRGQTLTGYWFLTQTN